MKKYEWAGEKIHYLPNGVDFDHFNKADPSLPADYNDIPSPRIVYVGSIAEWFDVELIKKAARTLPACSFVFPSLSLTVFFERESTHFFNISLRRANYHLLLYHVYTTKFKYAEKCKVIQIKCFFSSRIVFLSSGIISTD